MPSDDFCEVCEQEHQQDRRKPEDRKAPLFGWDRKGAPNYGVRRCWEHWGPDDANQNRYREYIQLSRNELQGAQLQGSNLRAVQLQAATLKDAKFDGADLTAAHLEGVEICGVFHVTNAFNATFTGAKLEGAYLSKMNLWNCDFTSARLSKADLRGSDLRWATFKDADMRWALLQAANLSNSVLNGANMQGVRMWRYTFWFMLLDGASLLLKLLRRVFRVTETVPMSRCGPNWLRWWAAKRDSEHQVQPRSDEAEEVTEKHRKHERSLRMAIVRFREIMMPDHIITPPPKAWPKTRIPITMWRGISGVDSCRTQDSVTARYISDLGLVEEFRNQHRFLAWGWRWSCFYGQSFLLWAFWCSVAVMIFGALYSGGELVALASAEMQSIECGNPIPADLPSWLTPYYFSTVTFTTLGFGDIRPLNAWGEFVVIVEVILGYIALGLLISILANKVARRA